MSASAQPRLARQQPASAVGCSRGRPRRRHTRPRRAALAYRRSSRPSEPTMSIARSEYTYCAPTIPTTLSIVRDGEPVRSAAPGDLPAVVGAGLRVPTLTGDAEYANLDHAASTPALVSVKAAVDTALQTYSSVHRGNGYASRVTSAWYEEARHEVARFVGAREDDLVLFTRNTTDS